MVSEGGDSVDSVSILRNPCAALAGLGKLRALDLRELRALRPERLRWLNNLSGKQQTPCDLGLCKSKPDAKTAAFQGQA